MISDMAEANPLPVYPIAKDRTVTVSATQAATVALVFLAVQLLLVGRHEMWLDELQAWMIARDSDSLVQLLKNLRYEGHPALWHLLLLPIVRLFPSPEAMQVLHVTIASASIYLLVRYAPFTIAVKLLLCLSYFLFFEYSQLARNYAPGIFLAFSFCALFPERKSRPLLLASIIFLLAQTSVYGTIVGIGLTAALCVDDVVKARSFRPLLHLSKSETLAAFIIASGLALAILQLRPPPDAVSAVGWHFGPDVRRVVFAVQALVGGYLPFPKLQLNFWNSLFLPPILVVAAVIYAVVIFAVSLRNKPSALAAYIIITVGCLLFVYVKHQGSLRHHGFLFIALVVSLWIAPACTSWRNHARPSDQGIARIANSALYFILLVQLAAGAIAVYHDYRFPFSGAKEAASFLERHAGADDLIAGTSFMSVAVSGYLNRPIYQTETGRYETFARWDNWWRDVKWLNDPRKFRLALPIPLLARLTERNKLFVISHRPLGIRSPGVSIKKVFQSSDAIEASSSVIIYEVTR